jgi:hypothetical protein
MARGIRKTTVGHVLPAQVPLDTGAPKLLDYLRTYGPLAAYQRCGRIPVGMATTACSIGSRSRFSTRRSIQEKQRALDATLHAAVRHLQLERITVAPGK